MSYPGRPYFPNDTESPCDFCGKYADECECPECPVCGWVGRLACVEEHGYCPECIILGFTCQNCQDYRDLQGIYAAVGRIGETSSFPLVGEEWPTFELYEDIPEPTEFLTEEEAARIPF